MSTIVNEKEIIEERASTTAEPFNLMKFLREVRVEFVKITWPSREQVTREFFSVLLLVFVIAGIIFLLDKVFEFIVNFFNGRLF
ncbi:MAG: preprotein translocase subunit SecE [Candidatus Melainabacteria bacterium RIFCSPLOWO2_02_FULL_35_15]|nr:MAG: preprotein translocase subunit SecE [Candidatus Melainabacteria bacterium RIFCSPLOWO2_12_FULL_35_11]OGI14713.1 MAG: preprotein translocase subunit SecE [Candidatus Melainabacteria bacterium RIFCSPLOWO2_02_FULL_35_15]